MCILNTYTNFGMLIWRMTNESFDLSRRVIAVYAGSSNSNVGLMRLSSWSPSSWSRPISRPISSISSEQWIEWSLRRSWRADGFSQILVSLCLKRVSYIFSTHCIYISYVSHWYLVPISNSLTTSRVHRQRMGLRTLLIVQCAIFLATLIEQLATQRATDRHDDEWKWV